MLNSVQQFISIRMSLLFTALFVCFFAPLAQTTYDANFQPIAFRNANKIHKVGANGSVAGNITLYTNVITIGGQQVDCIVSTVSLTNGTFQLPGGAAGGTIPFDYSSATGTGMSANEDNFFSPTFNFNAGGGSSRFRFQFILGGSYNDGTNTGTPVNLENVYLNSYDIDGNGGAGSNQFNEFNSFSSYSLGAGTTIGVSYNATSRLTRFLSSINTNVAVVTAQTTRIRLAFNTVSAIDVVVGSQGTGQAFFFLDFSIGGAAWTPTTVLSPVLDNNTSTSGTSNTGATCTSATPVTSGATNYVNSPGTVNEVRTTFPTASILNGNDETLVVNGSTAPANAPIALGFAGPVSSTFTLAGITFNAQRSVSGGVSTIVFTNNAGGSFSTAQAEALMDALQYKHNGVTPTDGDRVFSFTTQDGVFNSNTAAFTVNVGCSSLPVSWLYFKGTANAGWTELSWATSYESNNAYFEVEKSSNGVNYKPVSRVAAGINNANEYRFTDKFPGQGVSYYRLKQVDKDGTFRYSDVVRVNQTSADAISFTKSASSDRLQVSIPQTVKGQVQLLIFDTNGRQMLRKQITQGVNQVNIDQLISSGVYSIMIRNEQSVLFTGRFIK